MPIHKRMQTVTMAKLTARKPKPKPLITQSELNVAKHNNDD